MIRRMTFVCSAAMAVAVAIWFFGAGVAELSAQDKLVSHQIQGEGAGFAHAYDSVAGYCQYYENPEQVRDFYLYGPANVVMRDFGNRYHPCYRYRGDYRYYSPSGSAIKEPTDRGWADGYIVP